MYIQKNQLLEYFNVLSFRTRIKSSDICGMVQHIKRNTDVLGLSISGEILVTADSALPVTDGGELDVEFLVPVDKPFEDTPYFSFKPVLRLNNCMKLRYDGGLFGARETSVRMRSLIDRSDYTPVTGFYYALVRTCENHEINNITDIYVGVCRSAAATKNTITEKRSHSLCSFPNQTY